MDMTPKQLRMVDTALATHIRRLEQERGCVEEGSPDFSRLTENIAEYASFREDIEILLLRY